MCRCFIPSLLLSLLCSLTALGQTSVLSASADDASKASLKLLAHRNISLVKGGGVGGTDAFRVAYVGGKRGSDRVLARLPLPAALDEATLCFDVFFEEGFQFVKGGKLHGLGPSDPATGGEKVTPLEWSARMMFHHGGRLRGYTYHQELSGIYGEGPLSKDFRFKTGQWYRISHYVKLNHVSKRDGLCETFVDGRPVLQHKGLAIRGAADEAGRIQQMLFSTFHGGQSPSWAPRDKKGEYTTVYARFDNFAVYPGKLIRPAIKE